MPLEHILLGTLARPASGYDLKAGFESSARHFWYAELQQWLRSASLWVWNGPPTSAS